jgi:predicted ArsR family transcriptional regulator
LCINAEIYVSFQTVLSEIFGIATSLPIVKSRNYMHRLYLRLISICFLIFITIIIDIIVKYVNNYLRRQLLLVTRERKMSIQSPSTDPEFLDLLRTTGPLSVAELADAMEVTPTAVRQRLTRLMSREIIQREALRNGRGRPKHRYWLTDKGMRMTGSNFTDLSMVLWKEVRTLEDPELRRDMLRRIAQALASGYASQIQGDTPAERLHSVAEILAQRRIPSTVDDNTTCPSLTAHACPYQALAEQDHSVCTMERMMIAEMVGHDVKLTQCRQEGDEQCRFQVG